MNFKVTTTHKQHTRSCTKKFFPHLPASLNARLFAVFYSGRLVGLDRLHRQRQGQGSDSGRRLDGDQHQAHQEGRGRGRLQRLASQGDTTLFCVCFFDCTLHLLLHYLGSDVVVQFWVSKHTLGDGCKTTVTISQFCSEIPSAVRMEVEERCSAFFFSYLGRHTFMCGR